MTTGLLFSVLLFAAQVDGGVVDDGEWVEDGAWATEDGGVAEGDGVVEGDGGVAADSFETEGMFEVGDDGWIDVSDQDWEKEEALEGAYETDFETTIIGGRENNRVTGSAHEVSEEQLERYEYDDIHRVMKQVPGVYVREEDGFGLRPNIGLRGANSDRSAKVTLLEDGILLGPAPYSAPAAYYFPLTTRMVGVEVFKGPAAVKHGPNTVGGAINMRTRAIPWGLKGGVDVAGGAFLIRKGHAWVGWGTEYFGFLVEGVQLGTGGFKQLDGGGNTGFVRNDLMLKARVNNALDADWSHKLEIKVGYQDEDSRETYLGLTDDDFKDNPWRRYRATERAQMAWQRLQLQASYRTTFKELIDFRVTAYRHDFTRRWTKVNEFRSGPPLSSVLANPDRGQTAVYYQILKGNLDSEDLGQSLILGTNDRTFVSQGLQGVGKLTFDFWEIETTTEVGARLHQDQIDRTHTEDGMAMRDGHLHPDGTGTVLAVRNHGDALALATWAHHELTWRGLTIAPGVRAEIIRTGFNDYLADPEAADGEVTSNIRWTVLPGIGASWTPFDFVSVFGGVHRGFSPVAPGQPAEVQPEDSINAEAGGRLNADDTYVEVIGYFNRYANITGTCTFSAGCANDQLGDQYNGGEVWVYGAEALFGHEVRLPLGMRFRGDIVYTLTLSNFQTDFVSANPQFGRVTKGDALAYVPVHQGALLLTFSGRTFDLGMSASYLGPMRDTPGQGAILPGEGTDAGLILDATANWDLGGGFKVYFKADNLLNAAYIAARRPFGARPGKPRSFLVGLKYDFAL
jgi:Fe(3+) dicitrate transport protein